MNASVFRRKTFTAADPRSARLRYHWKIFAYAERCRTRHFSSWVIWAARYCTHQRNYTHSFVAFQDVTITILSVRLFWRGTAAEGCTDLCMMTWKVCGFRRENSFWMSVPAACTSRKMPNGSLLELLKIKPSSWHHCRQKAHAGQLLVLWHTPCGRHTKRRRLVGCLYWSSPQPAVAGSALNALCSEPCPCWDEWLFEKQAYIAPYLENLQRLKS